MADFSEGEGRLFIDGAFVDARTGALYENINPATEEPIGLVADAGPEDMEAAIAAARRAFDETDWSRNRALRRKCLEQLREGLEREREHLRSQTVAEVGCPIQLTYAVQCDSVIEDLRWPTELMDRFEWKRELGEYSYAGRTSRRIVWREPVGVVAAITPWNFPLQVNLAKVGPALAAGNAVVLKPAPDTPWVATFLAKVAAQYTDMPPGVFNVVTSKHPATVGEILTSDRRVDMVSFTGSTAVGRRIMAQSADSVKKIYLELGGKSANIMLDDADFELAIPQVEAACLHGGQGCALNTRLLLPRSRYEEGMALAKKSLENFPYGDPLDPQNLQGPLISARQRERVLGYIEKGLQEGAVLALGGRKPAHLPKGFYVEPTLFAEVDNSMTIAQEEIFGPVIVAIPYEDEDDAVRIANDSIYGLSGSINSASQARALSVAERIRVGTLAINGGLYFGPDAPFGGYKQSGVGREMGIEGFSEYLETKTLGLLD